MTNKTQHFGILTERDLISAWRSMLKERNADYCEVDVDQLVFGLIDETRTHYTQMGLSRPQMQALEDFSRTRWQWKRLKERIS